MALRSLPAGEGGGAKRRRVGAALMETPCIQTCVIDPVTGFCIGCGRTGAEVGGWIAMTPAERRAVMAALPERLRTMTSREARPRRSVRA